MEEMKTVEVPEPVATEEVQRPSVEEAKTAGWSAAEIESAKKRNMLVEEPTPEDKAKKESEEKVKAEAVAAAKVDDKPKQEQPRNAVGKFFDEEFTEEQRDEMRKIFPKIGEKENPAMAMYLMARKERFVKQQIKAELEAARKEVEMLKQKPNEIEKKTVLDEEGNEIDPDDKPLTVKQLRELQKQEAEEISKKQSEQQERAKRVTEAQEFQEEYAKSILPDFDDTVKKAGEVMQNLDALVPEKWKQARVVSLWRDLQSKAANADKIGVEDDNAAFVAYEIGKFHPEYGKQAEKLPDGKQPIVDPKANGGLTPEQMKKVEQNTQRRPSSAAIPSGNGRRSVVPEDVSREDINRMNYEDRSKFKRNHPEQYRKAVYENA